MYSHLCSNIHCVQWDHVIGETRQEKASRINCAKFNFVPLTCVCGEVSTDRCPHVPKCVVAESEEGVLDGLRGRAAATGEGEATAEAATAAAAAAAEAAAAEAAAAAVAAAAAAAAVAAAAAAAAEKAAAAALGGREVQGEEVSGEGEEQGEGERGEGEVGLGEGEQSPESSYKDGPPVHTQVVPGTE